MKGINLIKHIPRTLFFLLGVSMLFIASNSFSEYDWLPEFEDICGKTEDSGAMTKEELNALIDRCDKLRPIIEKSDNPQKKVYLFRLDKCKNLFIYVLQVNDREN